MSDKPIECPGVAGPTLTAFQYLSKRNWVATKRSMSCLNLEVASDRAWGCLKRRSSGQVHQALSLVTSSKLARQKKRAESCSSQSSSVPPPAHAVPVVYQQSKGISKEDISS